MIKERPQRRLLRLLRRTVKDEPSKTLQDEQALWLAHDRAAAQTREVIDALGKTMSSLSKQRVAVDAVVDRGRNLVARTAEIGKLAEREAEAFDRLALVGLNAGLEGARLGEHAGRALALVGEAVRAHSTQGAEANRDVSKRLEECRTEVFELHTQMDRLRDTASDATTESTRATSAASSADRSLGEMRDRLKKATGSDPETLRAVGEAAEHARALVGALGTLSGTVPQQILVGTLRPLLEPLLRLLFDDDVDEKDAP